MISKCYKEFIKWHCMFFLAPTNLSNNVQCIGHILERSDGSFRSWCTSFAMKYCPNCSVYNSLVSSASSNGPTFPIVSAIHVTNMLWSRTRVNRNMIDFEWFYIKFKRSNTINKTQHDTTICLTLQFYSAKHSLHDT